MTLARANGSQNSLGDDSKKNNAAPITSLNPLLINDKKVTPQTFRAAYVLKKIPNTEAWRLFVDGRLQNNSWALSEHPIAASLPFSSELLNLKCSTLFELYSQYPPGQQPKTRLEAFICLLKESYGSTFMSWKDEVDLNLTFEENFIGKKGWTGFECREPGYLSAICKSFSYALENMSSLSPMHFQILHYQATRDVKNLNFDQGAKNASVEFDEFRSNPRSYAYVQFKDTDMNVNDKKKFEDIRVALKEVFDKLISDKHKYLFLQTRDKASEVKEITHEHIGPRESWDALATELLSGDDVLHFCSIPLKNESFSDFIKVFIGRYEEQINLAGKDFDKKLEAIIRLIIDLHHLHPFSDGNTRVFGMVLLNQLSLANGLLPTFLYNPNDFERYPMAILKTKIIDGMKNALKLSLGLPIFNVATTEISESCSKKEKDYFQKSISVLGKYFQVPTENTLTVNIARKSKVACKTPIEDIVDVMFKLYNSNRLGEPLLELFIQLETRQQAFEIGKSILSGHPKDAQWKFTYFQPARKFSATAMDEKKALPCCIVM